MTDLIVSNQITCNRCGDSLWSGHRHDMKWCSCGSCAVDGGQDYLRRVGGDYTEQSIVMSADDVSEMVKAQEVSRLSGRNDYGLVLCTLRTLRDLGYKVTKEEG